MSRTSTEWPIDLDQTDTRPEEWGNYWQEEEILPPRKCVGCGYCCISVPCYLASDNRYWNVDHCTMLVWSERDKRYYCQAILDDPAIGNEWDLAVGTGCCSPLNTWRLDVKERRKSCLKST